jgi:predicted DsbA family dithiol-disulfide isomerase
MFISSSWRKDEREGADATITFMKVEIWTDVVCPWCYVGKRRFEKALANFDQRGHVEVVHRSFQLNPAAPLGETSPRRASLMVKYGLSEQQVDAMNARMEQTAAEEGLHYDLAGGVTGNTIDAHRLLQLAHDRGRQDEVIERLYRAYFTEKRSLFDHDSLVELAGEAGLDRDEVRRMLASHDYADAVERDINEARRLGVTGVPFFVIDQRYGLSGAQPPEVFGQALDRAWADAHEHADRP